MEKATQTTSESIWGSAQLSSTSEGPLKFVDLWAITEIAEMILAHLPMQDLLLAQRVSTDWKNLIKGSPVLQENLFLRPRRCRTTQRGSSHGMPVREYNPLLNEHMTRWFNIISWSEGDLDRVSFDKPGIDKRKAFLHRNASWRNMLLAQPPFTIFESVKTLYTNYRAEVLALSVGSIERPDGVRMGLAYDKAVELVMSKRGTFPKYFWTLMDGMFAPADDVVDDDDELERQHGVEKPERLFGGIGKFTMVTDTRPVSRVTLDAVRERIRHRYTSAGFEQVDILYHRVEPLDNETYNLGRWCWHSHLRLSQGRHHTGTIPRALRKLPRPSRQGDCGRTLSLSHTRRYLHRTKTSNAEGGGGGGSTERNADYPATVLFGNQADADYDAFAELTFADVAAFQTFFGICSQPENQARIQADEAKFLDSAKMTIVVVGETNVTTK